MSLGAFTSVVQGGGAPSAPVYLDVLSFAGDVYPTGGFVDFDDKLVALLGQNREIMAVTDQGANGYVVKWDYANKKLMVFQGDNTNAAAAPLIEVANTTNLAGVTFKVAVLSK